MYGLPKLSQKAHDEYCIVCGKKLIGDEFIKYDGKTGAPVYLLICPTKKCGHNGIDHSWVKRWHRLGKKCWKCDQYRSFYA